MEKLLLLVNLGFKYLSRYRRRYVFLFAALVFCFAIVTFITSSKDGMYRNVYYTAQSHYAGDVVAVGYNKDITVTHHISADLTRSFLNTVKDSGANPVNIVKRTFLGNMGVVYFNGKPVVQRYVIGCDWESEKDIFSMMDFSSPVTKPLGDDSIIISAPVAKQLNAAAGDIVILEVENKWGQKNTGQFIVAGIVQDSTIFGYFKVYISRLSLNRLLLFEDDDCSLIGLFFENSSDLEKNRSIIHNAMSGKIQTDRLVYDRDGMNDVLKEPWEWEGTNLMLFTLPVYLSEIASLMNAMDLLSYLLYGMMLIIILVSASVTYRLILHERTREMGVMRAIGFYGSDLRMVLWTEITILGIISIIAGFMLSLLFSFASSFISFSWFPSFEIFLRNGKLTALYLPGTVLFNIVITLLVLIISVFIPSMRASNKNLPSLLSGEPL